MIGELNASHLGVRAPDQPKRTSGRAGLRFERAAHERDGSLRVASILPRSPAEVAGTIVPGDVLVAVNGETIAADDSLDRLLDNTVGRETVLRFSRSGKPFEARLKPVDAA